MTEPTKQMIEMARRIWASQCEGDTSGVLSGALDGAAPMKLVLAAIMEMQDRVAALEGALQTIEDGTRYVDNAYAKSAHNIARSILSPAQQGNEFSLSRQQERMDEVARQGLPE